MKPLCHDDESFALLQFKVSFIISQSASHAPSAYPKVSLWRLENGDCCTWDGVRCNGNTGYVISLDLSSSCLYGSIDSNTSLFRLLHLQRLNLADNHFNHSQIPLGLWQLSKLTYLNLSESAFSGQIPPALLQLSELVSLDLSSNPLSLQSPGLRGFAEKLTKLEHLHLVGVNISSTVPNSFANLTSLTSLLLEDCGLHGEFPSGIFQLSNLRLLDLGSNPDLSGRIPEFNRSFPLEYLSVKSTSFSGELPNSIDNLKSLSTFDVGFCHFSGSVPPSLGNLTELSELRLKFNNFKPWTLSWLNKQTKLIILDVAKTNLYGNIPFSLVNLTQVRFLQLWSNKLTGPFPSWLANLTHLTDLALGANELHGPIPTSISNLVNLQSLTLHSNHLSGTVEFDLFYNLKNLTDLELSVNNLSLLVRPNTTTSREKFKVLGLSFCGLSDFPDFLRNEDELEYLVLSQNKIHGQIPKWMWSLSKDTLQCLEMSNNFLTGFEQAPDFPPWTNLRVLDLSRNELQGSLPVPPPSIYVYYIANNMFSGEISPMICNLSHLSILEMSYNNLSGFLPGCLGNLNDLLILSLQGNNFHGSIPQMFMRGSKLRMINLNQNHLQGPLPRSLLNCTKLELRVLILRSNGFHGVIGEPLSNFEFPKLQIIDFSNNSFKGKLPSKYFQNWQAMRIIDVGRLKYMHAIPGFQIPGRIWSARYDYQMSLTNKGIETKYWKIQDFLVAIDLSSNRFEGEIPEVVGNLKGLHMLNLSNNVLTGSIPSSLANLTNLESLDLSQNKLFGEIPPQLADLTFLASLNVSHNRLTGRIPQGKQIVTFENSSFDENAGLCGNPLSTKCGPVGNSSPPPSTFDKKQSSKSPIEFGWKVVVVGYGCGLIVGVLIGQIVITRKIDWFIKTFAIDQQTRRLVNWKGRRN
ncbi:hypothetical protein ACB098_01G357300 [Castanea mollissima]